MSSAWPAREPAEVAQQRRLQLTVERLQVHAAVLHAAVVGRWALALNPRPTAVAKLSF